jgi:hypothetical protein
MATIQLVVEVPGRSLDETILINHSYLLLTYDDGTQYYMRGGSSSGDETGNLDGTWGLYVPGTPDYDDEGDNYYNVIFTGSDEEVQADYDLMVARAEEINAADYAYDGFVNDSNAFAGQMLLAIGITPDESLIPTIGPEGYTAFLTGFFNPVPY